jgi:hypothetical protein
MRLGGRGELDSKCIPICRWIWGRLSVALGLTGLGGHGREEISDIKKKKRRWSSRHQDVCEHVAGGDECDTEPKKDSYLKEEISDSCCSEQRRGSHSQHPQQLQDEIPENHPSPEHSAQPHRLLLSMPCLAPFSCVSSSIPLPAMVSHIPQFYSFCPAFWFISLRSSGV